MHWLQSIPTHSYTPSTAVIQECDDCLLQSPIHRYRFRFPITRVNYSLSVYSQTELPQSNLHRSWSSKLQWIHDWIPKWSPRKPWICKAPSQKFLPLSRFFIVTLVPCPTIFSCRVKVSYLFAFYGFLWSMVEWFAVAGRESLLWEEDFNGKTLDVDLNIFTVSIRVVCDPSPWFATFKAVITSFEFIFEFPKHCNCMFPRHC